MIITLQGKEIVAYLASLDANIFISSVQWYVLCLCKSIIGIYIVIVLKIWSIILENMYMQIERHAINTYFYYFIIHFNFLKTVNIVINFVICVSL